MQSPIEDAVLAQIRDVVKVRAGMWKDMDTVILLSPEQSAYLKEHLEVKSSEELKQMYSAIPEEASQLGREFDATKRQISSLEEGLVSLRGQLGEKKDCLSAIGNIKEHILHDKAKLDMYQRQYSELREFVRTSEGSYVRVP